MTSSEFESGRLYYLAELVPWRGNLVPHISTWVFDGSTDAPPDWGSYDGTKPACAFSLLCNDEGWKNSSVNRFFLDIEDAKKSMRSLRDLIPKVMELEDRLKTVRPEDADSVENDFLERAIEIALGTPRTQSHDSESPVGFVVGQFYYKSRGCISWKGRTEVNVSTYVFNGMNVLPCVAAWKRCHAPKIHQFTLVNNLDGERLELGKTGNYRDAISAREMFTTWNEFRVSVETKATELEQLRAYRPAANIKKSQETWRKVLWSRGESDEAIEDLADPEGVKQVHISSRNFTEEGLANLRRLTNLEAMRLWGRSVTGASFFGLRELTNLKHLELIDCVLDASASEELGALRRLERLTLRKCRFAQGGLRHLTGLEHLWDLSLDKSTIDDDALSHIAELRGLTSLELSRTQITDARLSDLSALPRLSTLRLEWTRITDAGVLTLSTFSYLKRLHLAFTSIHNESLDALRRLPALEDLNVRTTHVTDAGVSRFRADCPDCFVRR